MTSARTLIVALCAVFLGCSTALPPAPPLPAGIAELRLPRDARGLAAIAADEEPSGALTRRREVTADVSRQLLSAPSPDVLVPELFDLLVVMAPRMESGAISPAWGSYVYTSYERDLTHERPTGVPRRSRAEVERALRGYVDFFRLQARDRHAPWTGEGAAMEDTQAWRTERRMGR